MDVRIELEFLSRDVLWIANCLNYLSRKASTDRVHHDTSMKYYSHGRQYCTCIASRYIVHSTIW